MARIEGDSKVIENITEAAWTLSDAFCYNDYIVVEPDADGKTFCPKCGSDDLMRHVKGVGVEYGIEWVVAHIIQSDFEEVTDSELEDMAEALIDECHPEVKIGGVTFSPGRILRELDEISFGEWADGERGSMLEGGSAVEVDGKLYRVSSDYL